MKISSAKDLIVYKRGYELSMRIFELSKRFPALIGRGEDKLRRDRD
jgi:hypothetical protein